MLSPLIMPACIRIEGTLNSIRLPPLLRPYLFILHNRVIELFSFSPFSRTAQQSSRASGAKIPGFDPPPQKKKPTALLRRRKSRCPLLASASSSWGVMGVCDACGRRRRLFKPHSLSVGRRRSPHLLTAERDERASLLSFPG